ncbi:Actin-binding LIM protein 1 isoform X6 [Oopsacas minuta]|uniref:Actin-binding LIM protein 1 isoform X6 n=1 Tax=Oopsacas minuta TaxID=111878 RepID=A0AAV7K8R4_9METZ|nr:Actin-binding LIM protein 1 isoform X6 [Oopsacas minuta]
MSYQNIQDFNGQPDGRKNTDKKRKRRVRCHKCHEPCSGEVLKVQDRHFHINCFYCSVCNHRLFSGGFYVRGEEYYCTDDYQNLYGTKCFVCHKYVEGEVVTALNNTYHKECFSCDSCKLTFSPGSTVTYDGRSYLCQNCLDLNRSPSTGFNSTVPDIGLPPTVFPNNFEARSSYNNHFLTPYEPPSRRQEEKRVKCYKCHQYINHSTLVVAMDKLWHQWCFTCLVCQRMMAGKFVARGDDIYCEKHYFETFGVRCISCHKYITGKVLMANKACYHYECAVCAYCNLSFNNDQDLYKESDGARLWHQECGLTSRQQLISRPEDIANEENNLSSIMISDISTGSHPFSREEMKTPTPQSEDVSISIASGMQSPPKVTHVRDFSHDSNDLNSQRSRHNSLLSQNTPNSPNGISSLQSTASDSQLTQIQEKKDKKIFSPKNEPPLGGVLRNSTNTHLSQSRRRVMSDTYHSIIHSNSNSNNKNFKQAHEFFTSKGLSTETLQLPGNENSPSSIRHRQNSDISTNSSNSGDKQLNPISISPKRSPLITSSETSTLKRTLKETYNYFDSTVAEQVEDPSPVLEEIPTASFISVQNSTTTTSSSSSLNSNATRLECSISDHSSPSSDPTRRVERNIQKHNVDSYNSLNKSKRKSRVKSAVLNTKSASYNPTIYPLERLLVTAGEYQVFPKDVDRYKLEQHLSEEDFSLIFSMSKVEFYGMPPWKQSDLKKRVKLF